MSQPKPVEASAGAAPLLALLETEAAMRTAASTAELDILAANDVMRLSGARQVFVVARGVRDLRIEAVSGLASVDPHAPLVQELERVLAKADGGGRLAGSLDLDRDVAAAPADSALAAYPFQHVLWLSFPSSHAADAQVVAGGLIAARERPWAPGDHVVLERLAGTIGHARRALRLERRWVPRRRHVVRGALFAMLAALVLLAIPLRMSALAPFETGSSDATVVAAPLDGIIEDIPVEPNALVKKGDVLIRFTETELANKVAIAEQEVEVARARLAQATQLAFREARGRHDMGIARAELDLRSAELGYARDLHSKCVVTADRDGVAMFTDKRELIGKPVETGFRVMEIANPLKPELRIDIAIGDSIGLEEGAIVTAYFDGDPLNARVGRLRRADYLARERPGGILAFRALADLDGDSGPGLPRLGARGTAEIAGGKAPLGYVLFRRPITAIRQRLGL